MRTAPVPFLRARLVALFLLSLAAVYGLGLSLAPVSMHRPVQMIWPPVLLSLSTLAGAAAMDRLFSVVDRAGRGRLQLIGWIIYGFLLLMVTLGIFSGEHGRDTVRSGAGLLRFVQAGFLLLAGLGRGHLGAIVNAFAMTCVAALGGGPSAALAVSSHAGLVVFFLSADHHARLLSDFPVNEPPRAAPVLGRAALVALGVAGVLALFFWAVPCVPYAPLLARGAGTPAVPPEQAWRLIRDLVSIAALAGLAFWVILWVGGGRGRDVSTPPVRSVVPRRQSTPRAAPTASPDRPTSEDWRSRIIGVYVRLLDQLARLGIRRRPCETPREFSRTLAPEGAATVLTELFVRARYGERDLTQADFESASRAGGEVLDRFRGRT
jgi:hypothetical protein